MRTRRRLLVATGVWLIAVTAAGLGVAHTQSSQRQDLLDRFDSQAVTGARFVSAYADDVFARERRLADGLPVRGTDDRRLTRQTRMAGFEAAVLLDARGRVVATNPPDPALAGTLLAPRYAHLSAALAGHRAVSMVVPSAVRHEPVVAFALPLRGPSGGVLSSAFSLQESPLKTFLARVTRGGRGYVVDARGQVAAYAGPGAASTLSAVEASRAHDGVTVSAGRVWARAPVAGTPWTLVADAPAGSVLDPVTRDDQLGWTVLALGAAVTLLGLVVTVLVAGAREQARKERAEAEQRFRLTFENAPIGMTMVTLDGRLVEPNRQLCQMLGYDAATLETKRFQDVTHPEDIAADEAHLERLRAGVVDHYELDKRYVTADDRVLWARLTVSLVRDATGRPLHYVCQVQDVTEVRAAHAELHRMAMYDTLTGLPNRDLLQRELGRLLKEGLPGSYTAVAFCDLDRFKAVNDSLGHQVGDELLAAIGRRLHDNVRAGDTVARWGGDEFVLLMPGLASTSAAESVLERTRRAVEEPVVCSGRTIGVGISVGVTIAAAGADPAQVLRAADRALYVAKGLARRRSDRRRRASTPARNLGLPNQPVDDLQGAIHCESASPTRQLVVDTPSHQLGR